MVVGCVLGEGDPWSRLPAAAQARLASQHAVAAAAVDALQRRCGGLASRAWPEGIMPLARRRRRGSAQVPSWQAWLDACAVAIMLLQFSPAHMHMGLRLMHNHRLHL
jgi:hypothetical protein